MLPSNYWCSCNTPLTSSAVVNWYRIPIPTSWVCCAGAPLYNNDSDAERTTGSPQAFRAL